jgi:hypothetical protein
LEINLAAASELLPAASELLAATSELLPATSELLPATSELLPATSELLPRARLAACSPDPPVIDVVPVVGARQRLVGSTVEVNVLASRPNK